MKEVFATQKAPAAIGPYSQAVGSCGLVFCSGQIPLTPEGVMVEGTIADQTRQSLENLSAVLAAAGLTMADVIKTTVFLTDMGDFAEMNKVYATYFPNACPARSAVQVAALPKGAHVEIEAIAGTQA